jgi:hypothetical protein
METPGKYNIVMYQGASFDYTFTWKLNNSTVNLTGYTARMQVRRNHRSEDVVLSFTDQDGITLGGSTGTVTVEADPETTAAVDAASYVYDLELESPGGEVYRILEGTFRVSPEVTRD